jgi:hypothetical protein
LLFKDTLFDKLYGHGLQIRASVGILLMLIFDSCQAEKQTERKDVHQKPLLLHLMGS